jgi:ferritin-like metal-binding protein YciE
VRGKIKDMPVDLLGQWAGEAQGERHIRHMVEEAEEVFLRAWFERKIEQGKEQIIDLEQDEEI